MSKTKKTTKIRNTVSNILIPHLAGWREGDKGLFLADEEARSIAQNLIDTTEEHAHLREAKLLILFKTGQKPNADNLVSMGKSAKATGLVRLLTAGGEGEDKQPDFIIFINSDQWADMPDGYREGLIDHELTHCAATIAGKFLTDKKLKDFVDAVGKDHIETCRDVTDDTGRTMVRYRKRRGDVKPGEEGYHDQPFAWRIRKHDVQEFISVTERRGGWYEQLGRLIDVIEKADDGQLDLPLKAEAA